MRLFSWTRISLSDLLRVIPTQVLQEPLADVKLAKISSNILAWPIKGSAFGLTPGEIEDIKEDHKNSNKMQKVAMLRRWAQKNGDQATLRLLLEILCEYHCEEEAKQVCECLGYPISMKGKLI